MDTLYCLNISMVTIRFVSSLPYLGKITEKVVVKIALEIRNHLNTYNFNQPPQSAYTENHRAEMAIVKMVNDMLRSLDKGPCVLLVMLDLSVAFDSVDHELLFHIGAFKCMNP